MSCYQYTVADARGWKRIQDVARDCSTSTDYVNKINSVTRMLMKRGNWWGVEILMRLCVHGCRIAWPKYVGTVTGLRFCCFGQLEIQNGWYGILGPMGSSGAYAAGYGAYSGIGFGGWIAPTLFDGNTSPVHTQITGNTGHFIRYSVVKANDYGKKIRIYGTKFGGQPLQELDANGVWQNGITLTAQNPFAQSTDLVTRIDQVVREKTEGMTYLYEFDGVQNKQLQLAVYEPNETNPQYRISNVTGFNQIRGNEDANGQKTWTVDAMVKLQYFPVENDRDFLYVGDEDALAFGIQSLNADNDNDPAMAETYFAKAIRELNFESRDRNPAQTFVVKSRMLGSCTIISNPI